MTLPRSLRALSYLNRLSEVARCFLVFRNPGALIGRYLRVQNQTYPCGLETLDGMRLEITSFHDDVTAWVIFCREEYGMPAYVQTVLDIGANYGAFSLWASRRAPTARLIAIEPFPDCYARLGRHIESNALTKRTVTWNIGLGPSSQDRFLARQSYPELEPPTQSRAFVGETLEMPDSIRISVVSMDDLVIRACQTFGCDEIDFVKLDIEGVEHTAITEAAVPALRRIRNLSMEYHPNGSKAALFQVLASAGLHCIADIPIHANSGVARFARNRSRR